MLKITKRLDSQPINLMRHFLDELLWWKKILQKSGGVENNSVPPLFIVSG
jgi:hypothetical protein